ncbi:MULTISPECIES: hypothetical protein [Aeromonas]|uniref:hypothetical protein n=1 Tax=Aeromonas TaxID=642 RepID=UPI000DF73649|nr:MULTISPECIES: hypothetical protein [Aeromonas]QQQ15864.1 hypothetical protein JJL53_24165 [Aeromonas media]RDD50699.1 hypothetical protein ASJ36_07755 [Aeromonas sp. ARM81]
MNTMLKVAPADLRGARTIGDLPSAECCMVALKIATVNIAERIGCTFHTAIKSSIPVYRAFDLTINQARAHKESALLLLNGLDLPVTFCEGEIGAFAQSRFNSRSTGC